MKKLIQQAAQYLVAAKQDDVSFWLRLKADVNDIWESGNAYCPIYGTYKTITEIVEEFCVEQNMAENEIEELAYDDDVIEEIMLTVMEIHNNK